MALKNTMLFFTVLRKKQFVTAMCMAIFILAYWNIVTLLEPSDHHKLPTMHRHRDNLYVDGNTYHSLIRNISSLLGFVFQCFFVVAKLILLQKNNIGILQICYKAL